MAERLLDNNNAAFTYRDTETRLEIFSLPFYGARYALITAFFLHGDDR